MKQINQLYTRINWRYETDQPVQISMVILPAKRPTQCCMAQKAHAFHLSLNREVLEPLTDKFRLRLVASFLGR